MLLRWPPPLCAANRRPGGRRSGGPGRSGRRAARAARQTILTLQRTAGNAAVARAIAPRALQRCGAGLWLHVVWQLGRRNSLDERSAPGCCARVGAALRACGAAGCCRSGSVRSRAYVATSFVMEAATPLRHARVTVLANRVLVDGLVGRRPDGGRARAGAGGGGRRPGAGRRRCDRDRRARAAPRADGRERRVRQGGVREDRPRARRGVRRALAQGRRAARPEVRRGVRARARAREPGARPPLRRRLVGRGPEPRQGDARRGRRADPRGPAQAVHRRLRRQPARDLPARVAGRRQAELRPAQHPPAGDERDDPGPAPGARAGARGEGEGRGRRARGRARHRQGPLVRGGGLRRARRDRRPPGRRLRRGRRRQGHHRKTGDVVVAIEGCTGPARGRIVFEAKASRLSKPKAVEELDRARTERNADYAVLVVPDEERIPAQACTSCASTAATSSSSASTPRTAPRCRSRSPTSSPARAC